MTGVVHADNGLVRISDHVYAYVDVQNASAVNSFGANAGIIIGEKGIAVVDTLVSAKEAQRFIRDIRKISGKPIRYAINTHYHLDHSFGNSEFAKQGAVIVAHVDCAGEMRQKADEALAGYAEFGLTPEDIAGTEIAYPEITFTDRMRLDLGGVEMEFIYRAPSHSKGSILVYLPQEKVVFAGDVLFTDYYVFMGEGDIDGWQRNLDFLATLEADKIIPGHGPLSGKKNVDEMKIYLADFDKKARELAEAPGKLEDMVMAMKEFLPARARGEWLIGASLQFKYLKESAAGNN
jgi:glyoxylase-like metal-dependent hydrolase (beta-lactamase superfamily II)